MSGTTDVTSRNGRRPLVLASASPARLRLLQTAGLCPEVIVSGVDEDGVDATDAVTLSLTLAERKAWAVAERLPDRLAGALVVGCDSVFELDGQLWGKPADAAEARARWRAMRNRTGTLHTGHCVIDAARRCHASGVASTDVHFADPTDDEIDRYVASGEPLQVAGAFTLDGRAAPFVAGVDGDPSNVIGLSLPLLRRLLHQIDVEVVDLWC